MIGLLARTESRGAIVCVLLSCLAGCSASFPWRKVPLDAASGLYDDAALTYRVDAGKLGQPLDVVRVERQRVSHEQVASSPLPDESIGMLSISYPHPAGRPGLALARFVLDSARPKADTEEPRPAWNPLRRKERNDKPEVPKSITGTQPQVHETWELDIAHAELDAIFKMLANLGFYDDTRSGSAHLTVRMNGVAQSKQWDQVPVLNQLVQRVRSQGRLVSYARPSASAGAPRETIASTAALHQLAAGLGLGAKTAPQVASAFALPQRFGAPPILAGTENLATAGPGLHAAQPAVSPSNPPATGYPARAAGQVEANVVR